MNNQVASGLRRFGAHHNADVRHVSAQVPGDQVAGKIRFAPRRDRQRLSLAGEKSHQVRHAAVIDVGVGARQEPSPLIWIRGEIPEHVFVDLFLQVDANGAVRADDFIGADARAGWNISVRIGNTDVGGIVTNGVVRSLRCGLNQLLKKSALGR